MNYINHVQISLINANNNISKLNHELLNMEGMSGNKTRYLEIGTWKCSSVCCV